MSNSSSKGTALITGASRGIGAVYAHVEALDYDFDLSKLERVISRPGEIEALANELDRRNLKRAIVVTGKTLGKSPLLAKVTGALGARCACVFTGVRQHVPISAVRELIGRNLEGFLPA
jgi:hypothetical protein